MVLDDATQEEGWQEAKRIILSYLDQGKSVVFLTLVILCSTARICMYTD